MKSSRLILTCILLTFVAALPAMAGPRIFVSGLGNDANPGTREQPKRTFASALTVTDAGGEVVVLDPAGFGSSTLTIDKSVSIIVPAGIFGGIRVNSGNAITVAAGPNDTVVLRGLTLNHGAGLNGIVFQSGRALHVENCIIDGFVGGHGILVSPSAGESARLFVKDTICRRNFNGVTYAAGRGSLDHVRLEQNSYGLYVSGSGTRVSTANSVASGNSFGLWGSAGELNIEDCLVANNPGRGITSDSGATVRVSNSTVTNNGFGLYITSGSTLKSRGNNTVDGNNPANVNGTITSLSGM